MTITPDALADVMPSATPTEADLTAWEALPRDQQLRRMQKVFDDPACSTVTKSSMNDVLRRARSRAGVAHG